MNIKIVILGNGQEWCEKSLTDITYLETVTLFNTEFPCDSRRLWVRLARIHYSKTLNRNKEAPFKSWWFPLFAKNISRNKDEKMIILIYDWNRLANNEPFLKYIRKHFQNCKLVYMFTNIVKISSAQFSGFVDKLKIYYDVVYAFDPADSVKYGFEYNPLIYSMNTTKTQPNLAAHEVFYVGAAKDRLPVLLEAYERLKRIGIKTNFSIVNVRPEDQKFSDDIKYNKWLSYSECLENIQAATCLLDIIQGESEGYTIKVCEAVFYNKLLITTNRKIVEAPFYDARYIKVISSVDDISERFFDIAPSEVHYSEEGKAFFAAGRFIEKLECDCGKK